MVAGRSLPERLAWSAVLPPLTSHQIIQPAARLVNPLHRLAVGRHQHDGTVVDDDLHLALVVLDDKLIVLDGSPAFGSP